MKRLRLLQLAIVCLLMQAKSSNAQLINLVEPTFLVNSPASVAGVKSYTVSNDGDPNGTGNWGRAIDSFWYNIPVAVQTNDSLGCINAPAGAFAGKFALISRGNCQFSEKAYFAQQAGAMGIIIYNNVPGAPVGMAAGNNATLVNIPVIMISQSDGIALSSLINNGQSVNASLTNWGFGFTHDLAIVNNAMALFHNSATPKYELNGDTAWANRSYLGALVANVGAANESSLKLKSTVSFVPTTGSSTVLLQDSVTTGTFNAIDSVIEMLSPRAQVLPAITQTGRIEAKYVLTAANSDDQNGNNVMTVSCDVTDSVYSKARLNSNGEPTATIGYRFSNSSTNTWGPLFYVNQGGHRAVKAQFTISSSDNTISLDGNTITLFVFKWVDANTDNLVDANELSLAGGGTKTFTSLDSNYDIFTVNLDALPNPNLPLMLDAKSWYWIAAEVPGTLFLGCDNGINYFMRSYTAKNSAIGSREYWAPQFQGSSNDLQNSSDHLIHFPFQAQATTDIDSVSFAASKGLVPAISLHTSSILVNSVKNTPSISQFIKVYPNPSTGETNITIDRAEKSQFVNVTVIDGVGRVVYKADKNLEANNSFKLDVSSLSNGNYFLVIRDGSFMTSTTISIVK